MAIERMPPRHGTTRTGALLTVLLVGVLLASACHREKVFTLPDVTGVMPPLEFTLTAPNGRAVHADDFRGKVTLLYFGYTHCPDVCPLTLATLAQTLRQLKAKADDVSVLFVSVDPARDTPRMLGDYAAAFGPSFVGLTGSPEQLQVLTKRYRVAYSLDKPDAKGNYTVAHSSGVFIFDRQGNARVLGSQQDGIAAFAHDLKLLLARPSDIAG